MDYNINIHKICRVCLEEGALSSIFHTDYTVLPAEMIVFCAKVKVLFVETLYNIDADAQT